MRNLTRQIVTVVLTFSISGVQSTAQSQAQANKKEETATVSGRVTIKGKGASGILVSLRKKDSGSPFDRSFREMTDQDGNYRITGVPAGHYLVAPLAPAFVTNSSYPRGRILQITAAEAVEGIDFALVRGGVITGKITDAEGRPIVEQRIDLISADPNTAEPLWNFYSRMGLETDDRGIYRLFGVPPGRYKVAVGNEGNSLGGGQGRRIEYKRTFHPEAIDPAKATIIELAEGAEATNVDITVSRTLQVFAARGRIVNSENGQPVPDVQFTLTRIFKHGGSSGGGSNQKSNSQGEFRIDNLVPGKYSVSADMPSDSNLRAEPVGFDVVDQDVTGLVIKVTRAGTSLSGKVVVQGSLDRNNPTKFSDLDLTISVSGEGGNEEMRGIHVASDGNFRVGGLRPGIANFSISDYRDSNKKKAYSIARVERDGVVQPGGIQIDNGRELTGVLVVLSASDAATIRGVVKWGNAPLPADVSLFIRLARPGEQHSNIHPESDSRGHFLVEGLAAGTYELTIYPHRLRSQQSIPSIKQLITVEEGAVTEVTLDLKPSSDSAPKP